MQTSFGMLGAWRPELGGLLFRAPKLSYACLYDQAGWPHADETDLRSLLPAVDRAAYFIYKEGGEPVAPFFSIHGRAALHEVREIGRFVELPVDRRLPDGGVVHVFENRSLSR